MSGETSPSGTPFGTAPGGTRHDPDVAASSERPRVCWRAGVAAVAFWATVLVVTIFLAAIALTRFWLVPNADGLRPRLIESLSTLTGQRVALGRLSADWNGWSPEFTIERLQVLDANGRVALELPRVDAALSWRSLLAFEPHLSSLTIHEPRVVVRRTSANELVVAGLGVDLEAAGGDGGLADWLLRQARVQVVRGEIAWVDEWRGLPPLYFSDLSAKLLSSGERHRAGLVATPRSGPSNAVGAAEAPAGGPSAPFELRADFRGRSARLIADWDGTAYVLIPETELAVWSRYLPLPLTFAAGRGALQAWFDFDDGAPVALTADIKAVETRVLLPPLAGSTAKAPPPLDATELAGRLTWRERTVSGGGTEQRWTVNGLRIQPLGHTAAIETRGEWTLEGVRANSGERQWRTTRARIDTIDLGVVSRLVEALPIPQLWRDRLTGLSARGVLRDVAFGARLDGEEIDVERFSARLDGVGWNPFERLPGVVGLAGELDIRPDGGQLRVDATSRTSGVSEAERQLAATRQRVLGGSGGPRIPPLAAPPAAPLTLTLPRVFTEPIVLTQLTGIVRWSNQSAGPPGGESVAAAPSAKPGRRSLAQVVLDDVRFATPHATGRLAGTWQPDALGPGVADLNGTLGTVRAVDVYRYLPLVVDPHARRWIERALRDGLAHDTRFRLKGALWHFPFHDAREGEFEVTTRAEDVTVDYADHWPPAERVNALVTFRGPGFVVRASRAQLNGTAVGPVEVKVDDMAAASATVDIRGSAQADLTQFLAFTARSPVERMLGGFTRGAEGSGATRLQLATSIPLHREGEFRLQGELSFEGAKIDLAGEAPPLTDVRGRLAFNPLGVRDISALTASALGGPVSIEVTSDASAVRVQARGSSRLVDVGAHFASPLVEWLDGTADWTLALTTPLGQRTPATGARDGPEGMMDIAARIKPRRWPLDEVFGVTRARDSTSPPIEVRLVRSSRRDGTDRVDLALGEQMQIAAERSRADASGTRRIERALVELGPTRTALPPRGVLLRGEAVSIDVDRAAAIWAIIEPKLAGSLGRPVEPAAGSADRLNVNLRAKEAIVLGHRFHDVSFRAQPAGQRWRLAVTARETSGSVSIDTNAKGEVDAVVMRLTRLTLPERAGRDARAVGVPPQGGLPATARALVRWPRLDVVADSFTTAGGAEWGKLELRAQPIERDWRVDELRITSPEGSISGSGHWRGVDGTAEGDRTELRLKLAWRDAGQFLKRLGYGGGVERAPGTIEGLFRWPGSPADFSHASAVGEFTLATGEGRFTQMDPGLGRLLGVLSLQSLPRRLSFSFDDLFGRGFAFDTIEAKVAVREGTASTDALTISGPSARVEIKGTADIERETQALRVRVYPSLSVATAIGIGIATANPAIGAAAYLGQKIARDPVERIMMQEFEVGGTWSAPTIQGAREGGAPRAAGG